MQKKEKIGLFILRIGLGSFLLFWGFDKLVAPGDTVKVFQFFYKMSIGIKAAYFIGVVEIILSIFIIMAFLKRWTYGIGLILHTFSTLSTWKQLFNPFGQNHLFIAGLPILTGFIALYLLRNRDTLLSWDDR